MTSPAQRKAEVDAITANIVERYKPRIPLATVSMPIEPEPVVDFEGLLNALQGIIDDSRDKHMSARDLKIFLDSVFARYQRVGGK